MSGAIVHSVPTLTHGRVLVRQAHSAASRGVLVGFHGYMENASLQMTRLEHIPGAEAWTLVAVQALHRFYRGRTEEIAASWMTREDRDDAIADNLAYVAAALELAPHDAGTRIVYVGFSQGVPMAYRAAVRGCDGAAAVIAVGGDTPPELIADPAAVFPRVLVLRGARDVEWYTQAKYEADLAALNGRRVDLRTAIYDGAHEWNAAVADAIAAFIRR